jgi:ATP-binding cassette subfamily B protein
MRDGESTGRSSGFDWAVWKKLGPFLRPYRGKLLTVILLMILTSLCDLANPLLLRRAIDRFIVPGQLDGLWGYALAYLGVITFSMLCVVVFCMAAISVEMYVGRDLKRALFKHLQTLSLDYYNTTPVGRILARVMSDTDKIGTTVAWSTVDIVWSFLYVVGAFAVMAALNAGLALLVLCIVPPIALATVYFQRRILAVNRDIRAANSRITGAFNEGIGGARTSKVLVIERENEKEFRGLTDAMCRASVKSAMLSAVYVPLMLIFGAAAVSIVAAKGGGMVLRGTLDFGTLSAFISYSLGIFEPIQQLARIFADFVSVQASIERVTDLLEREPLIRDTPEVEAKYGDAFHPKKENWEPLVGHIRFEDVTFRYPDGQENVLEHFHLDIPAGTTVAIVGETGAGKSTIVNLACRFFEPTGGRILIDGADCRARSQLWLHSNLGYVLQEPHLFSGTVRENIRYGRLDATDAEVEEAARLVRADRVAAKLAHGYDTDVGEGGDLLSTGEKQLISFARALLANPAIFVLDEATSSVDTETEQAIQSAIARLLEGRTSFIIAHRLSTIRHADVILVVNDGRIVERGTHAGLMAARGAYWRLYTRQFEEEALDAALPTA